MKHRQAIMLSERKQMTNIITRGPFFEVDRDFYDVDDMWMQLFNSPISSFKKMKDTGISVISRPHNVYTIKDKDGKVIGNKLEVVTTPYKKNDVSVEVRNGILTVNCEKTEMPETEQISAFEYEIHHGISSQSYSFSLKLSDKVDIDAIEAKNEDGILTIKMPFIKEEIKESVVKKITIQ